MSFCPANMCLSKSVGLSGLNFLDPWLGISLLENLPHYFVIQGLPGSAGAGEKGNEGMPVNKSLILKKITIINLREKGR